MSYQPKEEEQQQLIKTLAAQIVHKKNIKQDKYQQIDNVNGIRAKKKIYNHTNNQMGHTLLKSKTEVHQENQDIQSLDVSDMLKTVSHQKKVLSKKLKQELIQVHKQSQLNQDDYKHFMMISSQANYRKLQHPGYYKQLLSEIPKYPQLFFICIEKDIPRTMPSDHPLQESLRNVLYAYAIRNPSLLYCQGMNYLVGFLLINKFNEEQSFWLLVRLIEDIVMPDYFKDLSTISITVQIFEDIVAEVFPDLSNEMQEVGMESGIFLVGWYICLFTKGFINSVSQYLLQQIVLESFNYPIGFILTKISISILATLFTRQQHFEFQQKDFRSLKESLQNSVYQISLDELKKGLDYFEYDFEVYQKLAHIYITRKEKTHMKAIEKQLHEKKLSLPPCNIQKPVCIHRVEIEKKIGTIEEVLILKNDIPISQQLITNYFPGNVNKGQPKLVYQSPKQCPITHHSHICRISSQSKILPKKKLAEQSSKYSPIHEGECSIEIQSRFSKIEDRFTEFSQYFILDGDESPTQLSPDEITIIGTDEFQYEKTNKQKQQNETVDKTQASNFAASIGSVFRKVFDGIRRIKDKNIQ